MLKYPSHLTFKSISIQPSKLGSIKDTNLLKKQSIHSIQFCAEFTYNTIDGINTCKVHMILFYLIRENDEILMLNWYLTDSEGEIPVDEEEFVILLKDNLLDMLYSPERYCDIEIEIN